MNANDIALSKHRRPTWLIVYYCATWLPSLAFGLAHLAATVLRICVAFIVRHISAPQVADLRRQLDGCGLPGCKHCANARRALDLAISLDFADAECAQCRIEPTPPHAPFLVFDASALQPVDGCECGACVVLRTLPPT